MVILFRLGSTSSLYLHHALLLIKSCWSFWAVHLCESQAKETRACQLPSDAVVCWYVDTILQLIMEGLRGAVAFSLALIADTKNKNAIITTTLMIVLFTIICEGSLTAPLIRFLNVKKKLVFDDSYQANCKSHHRVSHCMRAKMIMFLLPKKCQTLLASQTHLVLIRILLICRYSTGIGGKWMTASSNLMWVANQDQDTKHISCMINRV